MAFYNDNEDENELENTPSTSTGQSGVISGQGAADGTAAASAKPDRPGNFVGLQTYLNANKVQSDKLGDKVASQISGSIQDASAQIGQMNNKFNERVDAGSIRNLGSAVDDVKDISNKAAYQAIGQGLSDDQTNRFKEVTTAQYKGPKDVLETDLYQPVYGKIKEAQNYANLSKNESGNQQLLMDMYKTPSYSAGENRFDAYLLNSEQNKQKLAQSRQNAEGLRANLDAASVTAKQYADKVAADTEKAKQSARKVFESTQGKRNQEVDAELDKERSGWNEEYDAYLNLLNSSNKSDLTLNDEQMKKLGVSSGDRIFNMLDGQNAADYLTLQEFDPNKVITKEQQTQLAALDQLAGLYGGESKNKYNQADLAGTLTRDIALAADKFGLAAKEQQVMFDAASKIATMTSSLDKSSPLYEEQVSSITKEITKHLPPPLDTVVETITEQITNNVKVGDVNTSTTASGSVYDYLSGVGPSYDTKGNKSLDFGAIVSPISLVSDRADNTINQLINQSKDETKNHWTNQILAYLQDAGYNNRIMSEAERQAQNEEMRRIKSNTSINNQGRNLDKKGR